MKTNSKFDNLRPPKGTLDLTPEDTAIKDAIIDICEKIFINHSGSKIETPTFELRENLQNKYGEDTKLIFNLEDQGGDICSLRYDLTVPFSRYLSKNKIKKLRKYQIGNVFRRDNPSKGRLREFTQADFDICGENMKMVDDSEILKMIYEILTNLKSKFELPNFTIRINDKRILMMLLEIANIKEESKNSICSTIDKADKLTQDALKNEFSKKGLKEEQIEYVFRFMKIKSNEDILNFLKINLSNQSIVEEFESLLKFCKIYEIDVKIDLSLARGLSYYTGLIIEGQFNNTEFGSICGGGRYDNLCDSISNHSVPCVGFSIGVSRIVSLLQSLGKSVKKQGGIFVGSGYGIVLESRMRILNKLFNYFRSETFTGSLRCETFTGKRVNYKEQLNYAIKNGFKFCIFTGENEEKELKVNLIDLRTMEKKIIKEEEILKQINLN